MTEHDLDMRKRAETAEWHLECLRNAVARDRKFRTSLKLTPTEARLLALLYKRELVGHEQAELLLYGDDTDGLNMIRVYISRMRGKLKYTGCTIKAVWGRGYQLENKEKLKPYIVFI